MYISSEALFLPAGDLEQLLQGGLWSDLLSRQQRLLLRLPLLSIVCDRVALRAARIYI